MEMNMNITVKGMEMDGAESGRLAPLQQQSAPLRKKSSDPCEMRSRGGFKTRSTPG